MIGAIPQGSSGMLDEYFEGDSTVKTGSRLVVALALICAFALTGLGQEAAAPAPAPQRIRISGGVAAGNIVKKVNPEYPPEARAQGISGAVVMRALISASGDVESATPVSGPSTLRQAAVDAVTQWKYRPYVLNGKPVAIDTTVTVMFTLSQ